MAWNSIWSALLPVLCALGSCAEHPTNASLQRELLDKSKEGLVLATFAAPSETALEVDDFAGRRQMLPINCCTLTNGRTISRNHIVLVDMTSAPKLDALRDPVGFVAGLPAYGGPVVALDTNGVVVARSIARFSPVVVSLSPDLEHFALMGLPLGHPNWPRGVNIGAFHEKEPRSLLPFKVAEHYERPEFTPVLDWSPDGKTVLFSHQGSVFVVDAAAGESKKIADGGGATWSPSGDWIAYISPQSASEVRLLNVTTGASTGFETGKDSAFPIEWSPDGKYLLVSAGNDFVYGGSPWIYRTSDGAWAPAPALQDGHLGPGMHWHWVQMETPAK